MKPDRSCAIKTGHFNVLTTADSNRTQAAAGHVALIPSGFVRMKPFRTARVRTFAGPAFRRCAWGGAGTAGKNGCCALQ